MTGVVGVTTTGVGWTVVEHAEIDVIKKAATVNFCHLVYVFMLFPSNIQTYFRHPEKKLYPSE
jgi:hypothetical protein